MYVCDECGCFFEEPDTYEESYPYGSTYEYVEYACCPECGGNFEMAKKCEWCGNYLPKDNYNETCDDCATDARQRIADAIYHTFYKDEFESLPDDAFDYIFKDVMELFMKEGQDGK